MIVEGTADAASTHQGHVPVLIVGGGQAGLSISYYLKQAGIGHLVLERDRIGSSWRSERWDSFCLVTPNWQCLLPDFPYRGNDPDGFMLKDEIVAYVEAFAEKVGAPVREGVKVLAVRRSEEGVYTVETTAGTWSADQVVVATSGYHHPSIPRLAERLPPDVRQLHSREYKNPAQVAAGAVLIIGTGQSGCQIAEDLHLAGRKVHVAVGSAPRSPRFYRGKDAIKWLDEMAYYQTTVDTHPLREKVRRKANHYLTGRDGGREIDLRRFAAEGMKLYGHLHTVEGPALTFKPDLAQSLAAADKVYNGIRDMIDNHIAECGIEAPVEPAYVPPWTVTAEPTALDLRDAGIATVIWGTGFRTDFSFIEVPVFDGRGYPGHNRGVTPVPGLYFVGLGWLWTWGSGRFSGIAEDARHIAATIEARQRMPSAVQPRARVA